MNCNICGCVLIGNYVYFNDQETVCVNCLQKHFKPVCISRERVKSKKEKAIDVLDGLIFILAPIAFVLLIVSFFWR